ncbi:hypothetical protein HPB51_007308 [Rhipicephalus microplus]|uniref:Peptidase M13 C-terminal domain-containing protein n=1 Tax=Rhipicephalus microplus TaxID=6941 RepID=A0A9J6EY60_RHIMP|nr:hypothetical protein HPB51_007308 [Rhipicephalus microplus]
MAPKFGRLANVTTVASVDVSPPTDLAATIRAIVRKELQRQGIGVDKTIPYPPTNPPHYTAAPLAPLPLSVCMADISETGNPRPHRDSLAADQRYGQRLHHGPTTQRSLVNDHTIDIPCYVAVGDLHTYTSPYVTKDRWVNAITTYTNGTYTAVDEILVEEPALNILVDALKDQLVGENGLRYLVAWSIYRQLVRYTVPDLLAKRRPASDACYEHADKAMHLALMSPYLQGDSYLDVSLDRLFPSWIKALSLSVRNLWADSRTWRYDEAQVEAYYEPSQNALVIPTAIISRPLFYDESPPALNYGSLGTIVGNEMIHAYDVTGIAYNEMAELRHWASASFTREYTQRALCLRQSHGAAVRQKARQELDDFSDSENIDDFVGVKIVYRAFSSLPYHERRLTLGGLNMSAERLFFIGHCIKWCSKVSNVADQYAPFRSRCVVPIMNMPEFSNAFGCAAVQPMNPKEKCNFWS